MASKAKEEAENMGDSPRNSARSVTFFFRCVRGTPHFRMRWIFVVGFVPYNTVQKAKKEEQTPRKTVAKSSTLPRTKAPWSILPSKRLTQ